MEIDKKRTEIEELEEKSELKIRRGGRQAGGPSGQIDLTG
jgi:hypothetical protein